MLGPEEIQEALIAVQQQQQQHQQHQQQQPHQQRRSQHGKSHDSPGRKRVPGKQVCLLLGPWWWPNGGRAIVGGQSDLLRSTIILLKFN